MKKLFIIFILSIILFLQVNVSAQSKSFDLTNQVLPFKLDITEHKTTILIFPSLIQSADRGDSYVLAERVAGVENVLKVKAAKKDFEPSNLQVITVDGKVYSFNVHYSAKPEYLTIDLRKQDPFAPVTFDGISLNRKELEFYSGVVAALDPSFKKANDTKYGVELYLQGVYTKNDVLFFSYRLKNYNTLKYDIGSLRFYTRDKKTARRSAIRDNETIPLYVSYVGKPEEPQGQTIVVALPKFSMAEDKLFAAELMEQNGDRNPVSHFGQSLLGKSKILR